MNQGLILLVTLLFCNTVYASEHITCPHTDEVKQNLRVITYGGRPSSGDIHADVSAKLQIAGHEASGFARLARYEVYRTKGPMPIADYIAIQFTPEKTLAVAENTSNLALLTCRYWLDYNATWPAFWEGEVWYASKIDYKENYFNLLFKIEKSRCTVSGKDGFDCEKL